MFFAVLHAKLWCFSNSNGVISQILHGFEALLSLKLWYQQKVLTTQPKPLPYKSTTTVDVAWFLKEKSLLGGLFPPRGALYCTQPWLAVPHRPHVASISMMETKIPHGIRTSYQGGYQLLRRHFYGQEQTAVWVISVSKSLPLWVPCLVNQVPVRETSQHICCWCVFLQSPWDCSRYSPAGTPYCS